VDLIVGWPAKICDERDRHSHLNTHTDQPPSRHDELRTGHAIYIFGPTGPSFGSFSVSLDNVVSSFNASTTLNTYNTLLFFSAGLTDTGHRATLTSLDGLFALDYIVAVSGSGGDSNLPGLGPGGSTVIGGTTTLGTISATDTPVFPGSGPSSDGGNNGAAGLAIGLTLGILAAIVSVSHREQ